MLAVGGKIDRLRVMGLECTFKVLAAGCRVVLGVGCRVGFGVGFRVQGSGSWVLEFRLLV